MKSHGDQWDAYMFNTFAALKPNASQADFEKQATALEGDRHS